MLTQKKCSVIGCMEDTPTIKGFCTKHYLKLRRYGNPLAGYENKHKMGEGWISHYGYHIRQVNNKKILVHRQVVEKVLGYGIPEGAEPHHVDGNRSNNLNQNLVLCDSRSYHRFLEIRTRAYKACGHANWRKCQYCHEYDDPQNMYVHQKGDRHHWHRECRNNYLKGRRANIK